MSGAKSLFGAAQRKRDNYISGSVKTKEDTVYTGIIVDVLTQYNSSKNEEFSSIKKGVKLIVSLYENNSKTAETREIYASDSPEEFFGHYGSPGNLLGRKVAVKCSGLSKLDILRGELFFISAGYENLEYNDQYIPISLGSLAGQKYNMRERQESFRRPSMESAGVVWIA
jgi:hypothetical protein